MLSDEPTSASTFFSEAAIIVGGGRSEVAVATVLRYAALGASRVLLVGRNEAKGVAVAKRVQAESGTLKPEFMAADLLDADQAAAVAAAAMERWNRIDVLVNTVSGGAGPRLLHDIPIQALQDAVTSQLMAPLHLCRAVLPYMQARGSGAIVNVASDAGKSPTPGESAIGAAMAAIIMFSRTMAMELKRNGIRVNVVTPSLINSTGGYERVQADEFASRLFSKATKLAALGLAEPDDLASLIVYLTGPESAKLTGQAISVNGGISAL
jgi:2-hydroxycyclohexanecarboxyl-CoA dehydrogenase